MKASRGRTAAIGAAATTAAGVLGIAAAARREGTSVRGWLASHVLVPLLYGRRGSTPDALRRRIADNRAAGPALPSAAVRKRYAFTDDRWGDTRVFRLAPGSGAGNATRILYLHGGAYVIDLMAVQWPIVTGLADRLGAEVVTPIYPLAPEHDVTEGLSAAEAVYRRMADEVGAANVTIVGDSAGGGLALALAHRLRDIREPLPAALVLFFPWLDVTCSGDDQPALIEREPLLSVDDLRDSGRMWARDLDPAAPIASPLFADHDGLPPMLALVGTRDMLLSDSRRLQARHPAAQVREYPGMFHGWVCAPIPEARRALDEAAAFAAQAMTPQ